MSHPSYKPWHKLPAKDMGPEVARLMDAFKKDQAGRRSRYIRNLELYEGRSLGGYSAHSYLSSDDEWESPDRLGLLRSAVASAVANIYAPQKPKPQFQTLGATWATRRKAYRLDRICEGILNQRQGRHINVWALIHSEACPETVSQGVSCIKVTADREQKRINHKVVPHINLFTDPCEGNDPKSLFERAPIDEGLALELFPKAEKEIRGAAVFDWGSKSDTRKPRAARVIEIIYAWRLPYGPEKPGVWCAVINSKVVDSGEWSAPAFPFTFLVWEPHRDGPWASGVIDEGQRLALDAGEVDKRLYHRELVASGKKIYYPRDSVKPDDLALNDAVVAVPYEGSQPPVESVATPFSPMELEYKDGKVREFWDAIGISQVSAAARREQGVSSGVAIMTLNDTKAGRQLPKAQRFENLFVDLANQYVWRLRELAEEDPDFMVTWPGKNILRQEKWADADVEDDSFSITVAPSANLPHDPAGRQETVQQLYAGGLISQERCLELMGWPDTDPELHNQESEYIDSLIERYLDADQETWEAGDYEAPEGFIFNKLGALKKFTSAWFRAKVDQRALPPEERGAAEFNIRHLVRYITELDGLMKPPPAPPMPAPPMAPNGMMPGVPGVPPGALPPPPPPPPPMPLAA
jgi:hypothetical protein